MNETEDNLDVKNASNILDKKHFGLEKVKRRLLEYIAVRKLKDDMRGPILCLVGPPGVGKQVSVPRSVRLSDERLFGWRLEGFETKRKFAGIADIHRSDAG